MLPSGLSEHIADEEDLARFLTQSSHYNTVMVKPSAFLPNKSSEGNYETSVSRHGREPNDRLRAIGQVVAGNSRRLHGAALFKAQIVRSAQLEVLADEPPDRHAVIRGWPLDDDPELQKAKQKERAVAIASFTEFLPLM
jgi:hypothetical protein